MRSSATGTTRVYSSVSCNLGQKLSVRNGIMHVMECRGLRSCKHHAAKLAGGTIICSRRIKVATFLDKLEGKVEEEEGDMFVVVPVLDSLPQWST